MTARTAGPPSRMAGAGLLGLLVAGVLVIAVTTTAMRTPASAVLDGGVPPSGVTCRDAPDGRLPLRVTTATLLSCPDVFDGLPVTLVGEVVGDLLGRGTRRWAQVNDDPYAFTGPLDVHHQALGTNSGIAVLFPPAFQPRILGSAGVWGDRVEVQGAFLAAAPQDQGGAAVIARDVRLLESGREVPTPVDPRLLLAAAVMALAAAAVWLDILRRERRLP